MAELRTLARPYAEAAFELAREGDRLAVWDEALAALATVIAHPDVHRLIGNPRIGAQELAQAIISVSGDDLDSDVANLVRLLAEKDRLALMPAIADHFSSRRAAAENRVDVTVVAADELSEAQLQALKAALEQRLSRTVGLSTEIDNDLIGGAIIRAGDLVIDGSIRAQLAGLKTSVAR